MKEQELRKKISDQLNNKPYELVTCYGTAYLGENYLIVEVRV